MVLNSEGAQTYTNVTGLYSSAISASNNPVVSGNTSVSMGNQNNITGNNSLATGNGNNLNSHNSFIIGTGNTSGGENSIVSGNLNTITTSPSSIFGGSNLNVTNSPNSFAIGHNHNITGATEAFASGNDNTITATRGSAFGAHNTASGLNSFAFGINNTASGTNSIALGNQNIVSGNNSMALGHDVNLSTVNSLHARFSGGIKLDVNSSDPGIPSKVINFDSFGMVGIGMSPDAIFKLKVNGNFHATGTRHQIGEHAVAGHDESIAIAPSNNPVTSAQATGNSSTAIGYAALASGSHSMALGVNNTSLLPPNQGTIASGHFSFAMGHNSIADGAYSTSIGTNLHITHDNAFMIGNSTNERYNSTAEHRFHIAARGGIEVCTKFSLPDDGLCLKGVKIPMNGESWVGYSASDKNLKESFESIDGESILSQLLNLDLTSWSYIGDLSNRHIGPVAQDFYKLFAGPYKLDSTKTRIISADVRGVNLVATKALIERTEKLQKENLDLKDRVKELEAKMELILERL